MVFQHTVVEKLGQEGFTEVFRRPPSTAQQILHPDKYFTHLEPTTPTAPKPPRLKEYKLLTDGTLGEFDHQLLLRQFGMEKEAPELAAHWRGGVYQLYERKDRTGAVLAYASDWDGAEAAGRFFASYRRVLKGKWKRLEVLTDQPERFTGNGDDGYFVVRLADSRVSSVEGLRSSEEAESLR
jgi:hypothetical protein